MNKEIRNQIRDLFDKAEKERLAAGQAVGHAVEDHQPAEYLTPEGWAMGCTCGAHGKRSARMSMRHVWFGAHVKKLGLPRFDCCDGKPYKQAVYMNGPAKGMTWDEARKRGVDING